MRPAGEVPGSVRCVACGYDLVGLGLEGRCPECGKGVQASVRACPRCPGSVLGRVESMRGRCMGCDACGGLGFERGDLRRTVEPMSREIRRAIVRGPVELTHQHAAACRRCGVPMAPARVASDILIDRCLGCGFVWVDAGELGHVVEFAARLVRSSGAIPREFEELMHDPESLRRAAAGSARGAGRGAGDHPLTLLELVCVVVGSLLG